MHNKVLQTLKRNRYPSKKEGFDKLYKNYQQVMYSHDIIIIIIDIGKRGYRTAHESEVAIALRKPTRTVARDGCVPPKAGPFAECRKFYQKLKKNEMKFYITLITLLTNPNRLYTNPEPNPIPNQ